MNFQLEGRHRPLALFLLPATFVLALLVSLGLSGQAQAAGTPYTADQRKEYFDSGKYAQDLNIVAANGRKFILERTQPSIRIVRACQAKKFPIGKADPGVDPAADYTVPVTVPKSQMPDRIVSAPSPGLGPVTNPAAPRVKLPKAQKPPKRITRKRCGNLPKLAIAMDLDETALSSYQFGNNPPDYDALEVQHLIAGDQTALSPMLNLYKLARNRGVAVFAITARPDTPELRASAEANLKAVGYSKLDGLYLKPALAPDKGTVKNSQRAEIVNRRGFKLIAMFGDQNSDLRTGFYERGFKYQSAVTPDQD